MKRLSLDLSHTSNFLTPEELSLMEPQVNLASHILDQKSGAGNDFLGWADLPVSYDKTEFGRIKLAASRIKSQSEALVVVGIGGSYLGSKAAIEFLNHPFYNLLPPQARQSPEIYYLGTGISSAYLAHVLQLLESRDFSVNVISKSGTTTEPAIAFRFLKNLLEKKYGKEKARERIFATTDSQRGALHTLAVQEGYERFVVPDDVGGRYSVLTAVGLLPIAVAGCSIDDLMEGARFAREDFQAPMDQNPVLQYAAARNILYRKDRWVELLVSYEPHCIFLAEWWKQLFGESEGKDGKGIFPASVNFTTDLHSMGQYIQEGRRNIFETVLHFQKPTIDLTIPSDEQDLDGLNYLSGKTVDFVNQKAMQGTVEAHVAGGVPNLILEIPEANAFHLGQLFYFFEKSCAISGYMLGVNPFDQPGVEAYKSNMFRLLGKKGY